MTILVIDVAAQHGGALTILNQFISEFREDKDNRYIVALSTLKYEDADNVAFLNFEWVKKSHFHRLFFDNYVVPKLVKKYRPDKLLSLQNNAYRVRGIQQETYFHNALPISEKRFSFIESRKLWIYQKLIGSAVRRSLKYADKITVQAQWIKRALVNKWGVDIGKVIVKKPRVVLSKRTACEYRPQALFYPANGSLYKNHITLIKALLPLWQKYNAPELRMTGNLKDLPKDCQEALNQNSYPVKFLGRLSKEEMVEQYENTILVFPSCIETIGLPLLEAKAMGCKIIVADCEYARESIGNYDDVLFFSASDVNALQKIIENRCL